MWYSSFVFNIVNKQYKVVQEIVTIPIPRQYINGSRLQEIFSLQHQIRKAFLPELPQTLIPLAFLSKIPSSADILEGFDLFVAVLSRQQGYHVDGLFLIPIENYLNFIWQTPYNIATIDKMLNTFGNKRYPKEAYDALIELNNAIYYRKPDSLLKFARLYTLETTPKDSNKWTSLLYPETSKYLLKEVAMISSEIIENTALGSLARTLRYFIRQKKYGYADDIRNARKESKDFEDIIAKMLREGRLRLEQKEKIHLPTDEEMKEVFRLANADFDKTKTALVILAFSFPARVEEVSEIQEEVQNA
jgi:CRISPR type I-A-associated protein Csa5